MTPFQRFDLQLWRAFSCAVRRFDSWRISHTDWR
jgi:hypothetical protein